MLRTNMCPMPRRESSGPHRTNRTAPEHRPDTPDTPIALPLRPRGAACCTCGRPGSTHRHCASCAASDMARRANDKDAADHCTCGPSYCDQCWSQRPDKYVCPGCATRRYDIHGHCNRCQQSLYGCTCSDGGKEQEGLDREDPKRRDCAVCEEPTAHAPCTSCGNDTAYCACLLALCDCCRAVSPDVNTAPVICTHCPGIAHGNECEKKGHGPAKYCGCSEPICVQCHAERVVGPIERIARCPGPCQRRRKLGPACPYCAIVLSRCPCAPPHQLVCNACAGGLCSPCQRRYNFCPHGHLPAMGKFL